MTTPSGPGGFNLPERWGITGSPSGGADTPAALAARTQEIVVGLLKEQAKALPGWTPLPAQFVARLVHWLGDILGLSDAVEDDLIDLFTGKWLTLENVRAKVADWPIFGDLVEVFTGVEDGDLTDLGTLVNGWKSNFSKFFDAFDGIDLDGDPGAVLKMLGGLLGMDVSAGTPTVSELLQTGLQLLFGQIPGGRLGMLPLGQIGNFNPNLLTAGGFPNAASISDNAVWTFDAAVSRSGDGSGSARTSANGTQKVLRSNFVEVSEGQKLDLSAWVKWSGLSSSGSPLKLGVRAFLGSTVVGDTTIASISSPGSSGGFTQLQGTFTVPAGVDRVYTRLIVEASATAGTVWFDDSSSKKTGLLQMAWTENLEQRWQQTAGLFGIVDTDLDGDVDFADVWRTVITGKFNPLAALNPGLFTPTLVGGHGGLSDLPTVVQAILDKVFPGGAGRSFADFANKGTDVANTADAAAAVGNDNAAVLAIRNNQAAYEAIDPTAQSTVPNSTFGSPLYTFGVTRTTAAAAFIRINADKTIGTINWIGYGNANITAAYLTAWKVDQTNGTRSRVYQSADVSGLMNSGTTVASAAWCNHDIPSGDRFAVSAGEAYVVELKVTGTGTHTVVGAVNATPVQPRTNIWPSKNGEVRNSNTGDSGTTSPATVLDSAVTYSNNVIAFEIGIADGDIQPPVYVPRTFTFPASDTFTIPDWAVYLDIIVCGGGQGGSNGGGGSVGVGGNNGNWGTATLLRGTDIPLSTTSLSVTVGAGGAHAAFSFSGGSNGGNSSVSGTGMTTVTGTGGSGGNAPSSQGAGDDDRTYNGVTYVQGNSTAAGPGSAAGNAPGGGGMGGTAFGAGGNGAPGQVWIVARTS